MVKRLVLVMTRGHSDSLMKLNCRAQCPRILHLVGIDIGKLILILAK